VVVLALPALGLFLGGCPQPESGGRRGGGAVNALALDNLVIAPVKDQEPNITIETEQYTGTIEWQKVDGTSHSGKFIAFTVYQAVVTLKAKPGYTFTGLGVNSFSYEGATTVTSAEGSGDTIIVTITFPKETVNYTLIQVSGGEVTSTIGNSGGPFNDFGSLPKSISAFSIGETEVTYELWKAVYDWATHDDREGGKYSFANKGREGNNGDEGATPTSEGKTKPVTEISWYDAVVWCNAYSEATGKTAVYKDNGVVLRTSEGINAANVGIDLNADGFRLPDEAEWEYAARGGDPTDSTNWNYEYAGSDTADEVAVYNTGGTATVKSRGANSLELYDMSGNVWEWCWDNLGTNRVIRGGGWYNLAFYCAVAYRGSSTPISRYDDIGFRVVCANTN
jgi:formylglycine-generating enzyme required for sulfatase activity